MNGGKKDLDGELRDLKMMVEDLIYMTIHIAQMGFLNGLYRKDKPGEREFHTVLGGIMKKYGEKWKMQGLQRDLNDILKDYDVDDDIR